MAYATIDDVRKILPEGEEIPEGEEESVETVLEEATDLVIGYIEREYTGSGGSDPDDPDEDDDGVPDDVPGAVRRVVARVTLRAFTDDPESPGAVVSTNLMGPFSHTLNWSKESIDRSVYLSAGEKLRLDRFKVGYTGGVAHVPMYTARGDRAF